MNCITLLLELAEITPAMIVLAHIGIFVIVGMAAGRVRDYISWKGNALP